MSDEKTDDAGLEGVGLGDGEQPPRARRSRLRRALLALGVAGGGLLLVIGLGGFLLVRQLDGNITSDDISDQLTNRPSRGFDGPDGPLNILVLGSDNRDGEGNDIGDVRGIGARADTTILLHVSADREDVYGVSMPRDAIVDRPDCVDDDGEVISGEASAMFNTAYAYGGAACAVQTVEQLTGVYIDHYVVVDFNGFSTMVDAVGGVDVCLPRDVVDPARGIDLRQGNQTLDGPDALDYVRERYVLSPNSDLGRMKRQQAFLASLTGKVISADTLARPDRLYRFLDSATESLTTDPGLASTRKLAGLGRQLDGTGVGRIRFTTVPVETYQPDPNRLVWAPRAAGLWELIRQDEPLTPEYSEDSVSVQDPTGRDRAAGASSGELEIGETGGWFGMGGWSAAAAAEETGPSPEEFGLCP